MEILVICEEPSYMLVVFNNMHVGLMVLQMQPQDCAGNDQEGIAGKISPKGMALL